LPCNTPVSTARGRAAGVGWTWVDPCVPSLTLRASLAGWGSTLLPPAAYSIIMSGLLSTRFADLLLFFRRTLLRLPCCSQASSSRLPALLETCPLYLRPLLYSAVRAYASSPVRVLFLVLAERRRLTFDASAPHFSTRSSAPHTPVYHSGLSTLVLGRAHQGLPRHSLWTGRRPGRVRAPSWSSPGFRLLDQQTPEERQLLVTKWFLSTLSGQFTRREKDTGSEKKPLNPSVWRRS